MTNINPDYDPDVGSIVPYVAPDTSTAPAHTGGITGDSSLALSEAILLTYFPSLHLPVLRAPNNDTPVAGLATAELIKFLMHQSMKMQEITNEMLDGWMKNLREIEETVRELINSPAYQAQQEIRIKGDPQHGVVSGVQRNVGANAAAHTPTATQTQDPSLFTVLERARTLGSLPPSAHIPGDDASSIIIPLTAAVFVAGALALGQFELSTTVGGMSSNPIDGTMELISKLQPTMPAVIQDILPIVNLMVMPLIYFTSWDSAVGSMQNKERDSHIGAAQDFAASVIRMVSDPAFVMMTFVNNMEGADKFSPERKAVLEATIKMILASVALTLLYSLDVGKTTGGKFMGMEPQEFRDTLSGDLPIADPSNPKLSQSQRLQLTLLKQIKSQLDVLPADEKAKTIDALLGYLGSSHDIDSMMDPVRVFTQVLASVDKEVGAV